MRWKFVRMTLSENFTLEYINEEISECWIELNMGSVGWNETKTYIINCEKTAICYQGVMTQNAW